LGLLAAGCQGDAGRPESATSPVLGAAAAKTTEPDCCPPPVAADVPALPAPRRMKIPDVTVVDQDGKKVRFYSDLVQGKVVAITFVFTSCKAACPLLGATFGEFQEKLGDRLGAEVFLISVSVDPVVDRPERLKEWAGRFAALPGWTLVTCAEGQKAEVDALLKALQVY